VQVFEGAATSKKLAMHIAARQALQAMTGEPSSESENITPIKNSPASKVLSAIASGKNPVMIVNEVYPSADYQFVSETGDGTTKSFEMSVSVEGQTFSGSGRSKRLAKAHAAQAALSELHGVVCLPSAGEPVCSQLFVRVCLSVSFLMFQCCTTSDRGPRLVVVWPVVFNRKHQKCDI